MKILAFALAALSFVSILTASISYETLRVTGEAPLSFVAMLGLWCAGLAGNVAVAFLIYHRK